MVQADRFYQALGLNVETYDLLTEQQAPAVEDDVEFFIRHAGRVGDPLLELGAGTGRVTLALARAEFQVVGLDISEAMLRCAEAKRAAEPAAVQNRARFVLGDMADFQLDETFSLVIVPYRSFQSLTSPQDQRRSLCCIHRHLRQGGRLIIDLFDPRLEWCAPDARPSLPNHSVQHPTTGNTVTVEVIHRSTDPLQQLITETWSFREVSDAGEVLRQAEEVLTLRWTYRHEMRYLFELTGFEVEAEFSDFHESPPAYGREQVWVVGKP